MPKKTVVIVDNRIKECWPEMKKTIENAGFAVHFTRTAAAGLREITLHLNSLICIVWGNFYCGDLDDNQGNELKSETQTAEFVLRETGYSGLILTTNVDSCSSDRFAKMRCRNYYDSDEGKFGEFIVNEIHRHQRTQPVATPSNQFYPNRLLD